MSDLSNVGKTGNSEGVSDDSDGSSFQPTSDVPGFTFQSTTETQLISSNVAPHEASSGLSTGSGEQQAVSVSSCGDGQTSSSVGEGLSIGKSLQAPPSESALSLEDATSAFFKAVEDGNLEAARAVAGQINGVNVQDKDGATALLKAAAKGYSAMVAWLLSLGADTNISSNVSTVKGMCPCVMYRLYETTILIMSLFENNCTSLLWLCFSNV